MVSVLRTAMEAVRSRTDITRFFLDNARLRNGVPKDTSRPEDAEVRVTHEHRHTGLPSPVAEKPEPVAEKLEPVVTERPDRSGSQPSPWIGWLAAALIAGGLGSSVTYLATRPDEQPPVIEHPLVVVEAPEPEPMLPPDAVQPKGSGSLLQYLEDQGEHLP